jgi:Tfp pilus assembly protein PilF
VVFLKKIIVLILVSFILGSFQIFPKDNSDKGDYSFFYQLADKYFKEEQYEKAIENYTKSIELKSDSIKAYVGRGVSYLRIKEYSKATEDFNIAIKIDPKSYLPYYNLGIVLFENNDYKNAIENLTKSISLKGDFIDSYIQRGLSYSLIQQFDEALSDFKKAIQINKEDYFANSNIARLYYKLQNYIEAKKYFEKTISLYPNRGYLYFFQLINAFKISSFEYNKALENLKSNMFRYKENKWVYLIANYYIGDISTEALLQGAEDNESLSEAYTYIGYKFLFENDKKSAKENFQKNIDLKITNFVENELAGYEIQSL